MKKQLAEMLVSLGFLNSGNPKDEAANINSGKTIWYCHKTEFFFLYARLKNSRIMLYPSASIRLSVRLSVHPSINFFVSV